KLVHQPACDPPAAVGAAHVQERDLELIAGEPEEAAAQDPDAGEDNAVKGAQEDAAIPELGLELSHELRDVLVAPPWGLVDVRDGAEAAALVHVGRANALGAVDLGDAPEVGRSQPADPQTATPFARSSSSARSDFSRLSRPWACRTSGVFVNWTSR